MNDGFARQPAPTELYIYYRAAPAHAQALQRAAQAMQQQLQRQHPGLAARLLYRAHDAHGTWMEIYVLPPDAEAAPIESAIEHAAAVLSPWLLGPRRTERFVACA